MAVSSMLRMRPRWARSDPSGSSIGRRRFVTRIGMTRRRRSVGNLVLNVGRFELDTNHRCNRDIALGARAIRDANEPGPELHAPEAVAIGDFLHGIIDALARQRA